MVAAPPVKPYRHTATKRGEPCAFAVREGLERPDCYGWNECERRCSRHHGMQQEKQRLARLQGPRIFPMPVGPNASKAGYCRWCDQEILHHEGKRAGETNTRRTWHDGRSAEPDCLGAFYLHTRSPEQTTFLIRRDGFRCADCQEVHAQWIEAHGLPKDPEKLRSWGPTWVRKYPPDVWVGAFCWLRFSTDMEVDHDAPLWSVADLPDDERAVYFGPANLRLRCGPCHKKKTAIEAKQRAIRGANPRLSSAP